MDDKTAKAIVRELGVRDDEDAQAVSDVVGNFWQ
jgi:hypothetical protein